MYVFPLQYSLEILGILEIGSFFKLASTYWAGNAPVLKSCVFLKCSSEGCRNALSDICQETRKLVGILLKSLSFALWFTSFSLRKCTQKLLFIWYVKDNMVVWIKCDSSFCVIWGRRECWHTCTSMYFLASSSKDNGPWHKVKLQQCCDWSCWHGVEF